MRSMREDEKNIWRMDYDWLREEIKSCFFYEPDLSSCLMKSIQKQEMIPAQVIGSIGLALVMRNPHWSVVEEEFLTLYGSLQIPVNRLFSDFCLMRYFYNLQHRGNDQPESTEVLLEMVKSLPSNRILSCYKPEKWSHLEEAKKTVRIEQSRVLWIQALMTKEDAGLPEWLKGAMESECGYGIDEANQWRIKMDRLQRRERTGVTNAEIRGHEAGEEIVHRWLGPMRVLERRQTAVGEEVLLQGLLRKYVFRYEKKR